MQKINRCYVINLKETAKCCFGFRLSIISNCFCKYAFSSLAKFVAADFEGSFTRMSKVSYLLLIAICVLRRRPTRLGKYSGLQRRIKYYLKKIERFAIWKFACFTCLGWNDKTLLKFSPACTSEIHVQKWCLVRIFFLFL